MLYRIDESEFVKKTLGCGILQRGSIPLTYGSVTRIQFRGHLPNETAVGKVHIACYKQSNTYLLRGNP
jgi:hypothetical protein